MREAGEIAKKQGGNLGIISKSGKMDSFSANTIRWQVGDTSKPDPFFILVINNIAIERPYKSGKFVPDMASSQSQGSFTACAEYLYHSVFGKLPKQAEKMLAKSPHAAKVRFHSMFVWGLLPNAATALIGEEQDSGTNMLVPRRLAVPAMLKYLSVNPDVVFIITKSPTHSRASAFPATDDLTQGGHQTTYDGQPFTHYFQHSVPGMAAIHATQSTALTGAHEFGHAFSSYPDGFIADLYLDGSTTFNRKVGRPIPATFAEYDGTTFTADAVRAGLAYPPDWQSYHCQLANPNYPALMDDFWRAKPDPMRCQHDTITTAFMLDRLAAKVMR